MARTIKPLTDKQVSNAKPEITKQKTLFDGAGLFLLISPKGGKWWRFKYQFNGKTKMVSFGTYPEVSLADAREKREVARKQVCAGIDPSGARKALKAATLANDETSFEVVALEWHSGKAANEWSTSHSETTIGRLRLDVFPAIGARAIAEIEAPELLAILRRIESRGALETAHRVRTICSQIFRYAIGTGRARRDWAADLIGILPAYTKGHHPAITDPKEVGPLLRTIDGYKGTFVVKCALQLSPYVFIRPGELREAEWSEFDLDAAEWNLPIERMKFKKRIKEARRGEKHLIPLSTQAVTILRNLKIMTGGGKYTFPGARSTSRVMSENTVNGALRRLGYDKDTMTGHGFRAMARTILDEVLGYRVDIIEHQTAHAVKDPNGRAYNRTTFLPERREMMQAWADYLESLKAEK